MAYKVAQYKAESEWLNKRRIGGSDASSIVGLNPWQSKWELFDRLMGKPAKGKPKAKKENPVLAYGHKAEPIIRKLFAIDHPGMKVIAPKGYEMYLSDISDWITATIDGLTFDQDGRKGILEIKTHDVRKADDYEEWKEGSLPRNYIIQVLHYLLVLCDAEYADFAVKIRFFGYDGKASFIKKTEVRYYHIERADVEKEIAWLRKEELAYIKDCLEPGIRPALPKVIPTKF